VTSYLVTGGAGFIGSNLVERLVAEGHFVRVLDNFSTGRRENITPFLSKIELIEGDLTDLSEARRATEGIEVVLHHGALPSVPKSVRDPLASNQANVLGTLHVLIAARDAGVRRVIYASSSSVYGDADPSRPKSEDMFPDPISPYGVTKLAAEHYCRVFWQVYGLETVALRYFNVFGPRQNPASQYAAVIPRFITAVLDGAQPTVYGDGEQTRDFTYVGNVVEGNLIAACAPADRVAGQVFNLASGGRISLNELIHALGEITGRPIQPTYTDPRPGDIKHSQAAVEKARAAMGYTAEIGFMDGLERTVAWYRRQAEVVSADA
jgi:nucleoside-diphosphate-sugar epimerase